MSMKSVIEYAKIRKFDVSVVEIHFPEALYSVARDGIISDLSVILFEWDTLNNRTAVEV